MIKVLFVCVHNSARSQMAEAFLNRLGNGDFYAESAGIEPGRLNPMAIKVMEEIGYDIRHNSTDSVFNFFKEGRTYSLLVKVCDQINGQKCPIFPMIHYVLDWNLEDPSGFEGTYEERLDKTRKVRDEIKAKVESLIAAYKD
ncbi:MAG: Glutaredoxin arsenate reductase [Candidatus Dichloromethanomonas elyunquensis]|nr:MAG: Glutaredoxin arsenate reductase [Candidatus Dichloromethanomonas elyunquensis]